MKNNNGETKVLDNPANDFRETIKNAITKIELLEKYNKLLIESNEILTKHNKLLQDEINRNRRTSTNILETFEDYATKEIEYKKRINEVGEKLKRNYTKDERLSKYKKVVEGIVKCESIGQVPNVQRICDKISGDDIWDLRPAFDRWKKRNPELYNEIKKEIELNI